MKTIQYTTFGGSEVLKLKEVARPIPAVDELLVRVEMTSVNPIDIALRAGYFFREMVTFPFTPGWDFVGRVEEVGGEIGRFKPDDTVFGFIPMRGGASAEYAIVKSTEAALKPDELPAPIAAALPSVGVTAWQALFEAGDLQAGETVLIHAGAGGVGHLAIQLAKWRGATVITTASAGNHDFLRQLGADEVIDYRMTDFAEVVSDVDMVLVSIAGESAEKSYRVLNAGGRYVSIVGPPDPAKCRQFNVIGKHVAVKPNPRQLDQIAQLVIAEQLQLTIDKTYPLDQLAAAQDFVAHGHTRGKVLIQL